MVHGCKFLGHELGELMDLRNRWIHTMRRNGAGPQIELVAARTDAKFEELFLYIGHCDQFLTMYGNEARASVAAGEQKQPAAPPAEPPAEQPSGKTIEFPKEG